MRKCVAQQIDEIFEHVGEAIACERLLPPFLQLAEDKSWVVRKACSVSSCTFCGKVPAKVRQQQLYKAMQKLVADGEKWVRVEAQKSGAVPLQVARGVSQEQLETFEGVFFAG